MAHARIPPVDRIEVTITDAAALLSVGVETVRELIRTGLLTPFLLGGRLHLRVRELETLRERVRTVPEPAAATSEEPRLNLAALPRRKEQVG